MATPTPRAGRSKRARRTQSNPPNPWLVIRRSGIHGRGAFARCDIPKGTRIIEYTGEHITNREADRRYDDARMKQHHTFLFILSSRTVVDGAVGGNQSRFINHSCDPNCETFVEGRHIYIYALKDIRAGEELAYDYRYDWDKKYTAKELAFYKCECGGKGCRGTMVMVPKRKRYLLRALRKGSGDATPPEPATLHRQARTAA